MDKIPRKKSWRRRLKRRLSARFRYSPLLKLLIQNPWFRAAFLLAFGVVLAGLLSIPKMWRTSPDGFEPVIRVSGIDLLQCWSLKRSAAKSIESGDYARAQMSWYMASGQNPSDLSTVRGFLDNFVKLDHPEKRMVNASLIQIGWLLRMGETNSADVVRAARVFDKQKWYSLAAAFLEPIEGNLAPEAEAVYAKALFHDGKIAKFKQVLDQAGSRLTSPDLDLYRQAYAMGWGSEVEAADAEKLLAAKMEDPAHGKQAARVYLLASAGRNNPAGYDQALRRLSLVNEAGVQDHARYWSMLARHGRKQEAVELADTFTTSPATPAELLQLADAFYGLGETNACREVLRKFVPGFAHDPEVWAYYSAFLQNIKDWSELREVALKIREQKELFAKLWGYSYFLEGLSDHRRSLFDSAAAAFSKAADLHFEIPAMAYRVAREMSQLNHHEPALKLLRKIESHFEERLEFWEAFFDAGYGARDSLAVLKAAEKAYRLKPADVQLHNRYAAALMLNRQNPEESIKLTLQLITSYPRSVAANINHGFALLLNHRAEEARKLLEGLSARSLEASERNALHLGLFEVYVVLEQWDKARQHVDKVVEATLFPNQRHWFHELRKRLPEPLLSAG